MTSGCPSDDVLAAHLAGALPEDAIVAIGDHLDGCDGCRAIVIAAVRGGVATPPERAPGPRASDATIAMPGARPGAGAPLPRGTRVGRYVIDRLLGAGGMGAVYAAHDEELDRAVALKLLRGGGSSRGLAERLARESRLLAKVRHPSVITVYDAGRDGDRVYVAMELVDGDTLGAWLRARRRPWRDVLAVFRRAGTGLAAAHRAGVVHRDVKPENVMIEGDAARVLVTDFGVARALADDDDRGDAAGDAPARGAGGLTRTGVAVGTPAYMAPEQLAAGAIDARTDVFGFAVALWEALYGERPFAGASIEELLAAIARGPRPPRADAPARALGTVPRWIARVLTDALAAEPARRPPSMDALLAALDPAPRARRRRLAIGAAAIAAAAAAIAIGLARAGAPADADADAACTARTAELDARWTPVARARARAALIPAHGAAVADRVLALTGQRVSEVELGIATVCRQDPIRTPDHAARLACLDARRLETLAFVEALDEASADAIAAAPAAAAGLERAADCMRAGPPRLQALVPAEPAARRAVERLRNRMIVIDDLRIAGRFADARAAAEAIAGEVAATRFPPLDAELALLRGSIAHEGMDSAHAAAALLDAANLAERAHHDYVSAAAWVQLVQVAALDQRDPARAREYYAQGRAALDRLGADPTLEIQLEYGRIETLLLDSKFDEARGALDRLLARARADAPDQVLAVATGLASLYEDAGRYDDAIRAYEAALAPARASGGPAEAMIHARLSNVRADRGQAALAVAEAAQARALYQARLGPDHVDRITSGLTWASALLAAGDPESALAAATDAERDLRRIFDARNPAVADALEDEGDALLALGRPRDGLARIARACEILAFASGEDSVDAAECRIDLAGARADQGDRAGAAARADDALADAELIAQALGDAHPTAAIARATVAHLDRLAGRGDDARAALAAAVPVLTASGVDPGHLATAELDLAALARDPAERRRLARLALAHLAVASPEFAPRIPDARALLR